ncbi:uncharacterized protein LOC120287080 [Eucalyptus grandis]|uniref:uncharacterized protein LOC120287080 n=1 Tax=Eucalyptus grandis TaxID=71139 RepID=UPI00192F0E4F|nr:uncharacterized protein LOC120287080 [Eucalyptus grandis]
MDFKCMVTLRIRPPASSYRCESNRKLVGCCIEKQNGLPKLETVAAILWHIWKARNNFLFRQQRPNVEQVVQSTLVDARSDWRFGQKRKRRGINQNDLNQQWHPPAKGFLKVNIDAAYLSHCNDASVACVCRDSSGILLDGFARSVSASSALRVEVLGLNQTLKFLLQRGRGSNYIEVESNCLTLVDAINDPP